MQAFGVKLNFYLKGSGQCKYFAYLIVDNWIKFLVAKITLKYFLKFSKFNHDK